MTQPLHTVRPLRRRPTASWSMVGVIALVCALGVLVIAVAATALDDSDDTETTTQARTGRSPLGCEVAATADPRVTAVTPPQCTYIELGKMYCAAQEPITFRGTGGDFGGRGMRGQTVDGFIDGRGRSFQWIISSAGQPVTVTSRLMCNDDGRVLPVSQDEIETLISVGDEVPPTLLSKIGLGGRTVSEALPPAPPSVEQSRTVVGGGDPTVCRTELSRLLQEVVSGRSSRDEAEARIPDASGTVALRSAIEAVARYRQDGLSEDESIAEAGGAFTYPCGER